MSRCYDHVTLSLLLEIMRDQFIVGRKVGLNIIESDKT